MQGQAEMQRKLVGTFPILLELFTLLILGVTEKRYSCISIPTPTPRQYPLFPKQKNFPYPLPVIGPFKKENAVHFFPFKSLRTTLWENSCHCQLAEETGCCSANGAHVITCIYSVCSPRYSGMLVSIKPACHLLWDLHTSVTPITSRLAIQLAYLRRM